MTAGKQILKLLLLFFILLSTGTTAVAADEIIRVTTEGTALSIANQPVEVRSKALAVAEQNALAKALAPEVSVQSLLVNARLSGSILGAIPCGKIIEKKIIDEGELHPAKDQAPQYRVKITAGVVEDTTPSAPCFSLDAALNRSIFKDGEELKLRITSNRNCYFAVFNIRRDDKIIPLLPNSQYKNNYLAANDAFKFPDKRARLKGYKLRVHLPKNKPAISEYIYVIALLQPLTLDSGRTQSASLETEEGQQALVRELVRKVVGIPIKNRQEVLMPYHIRKTGKGV